MKKDENIEGFNENKVHGRIDFPFALYRCEVPKWMRGYPLHWHKDVEIIYIESGTGLIRSGAVTYECSAGDIVVIPPEIVHEIRQKDKNEIVYYNIIFKLSLLEQNQESAFYKKFLEPFEDGTVSVPDYLPSGNEINTLLSEEIKPLVAVWHSDFSERQLLVKAKIFNIMNVLYSHGKRNENGQKLHDLSFHRMKELLDYIGKNYGSRISVEDAAKLCNYSESFFMKYFKKETGITFTLWLNSFRLEKAEEFLKTSDMNVSEAAEKCGFESLSYFIKCFKKKFGYTPHKAKVQME